jgi:hypothetical protein
VVFDSSWEVLDSFEAILASLEAFDSSWAVLDYSAVPEKKEVFDSSWAVLGSLEQILGSSEEILGSSEVLEKYEAFDS